MVAIKIPLLHGCIPAVMSFCCYFIASFTCTNRTIYTTITPGNYDLRHKSVGYLVLHPVKGVKLEKLLKGEKAMAMAGCRQS